MGKLLQTVCTVMILVCVTIDKTNAQGEASMCGAIIKFRTLSCNFVRSAMIQQLQNKKKIIALDLVSMDTIPFCIDTCSYMCTSTIPTVPSTACHCNHRICTVNASFLTFISAGTLGFYLNGVAYPDGSAVLRTDVGEDDNALQCTTDSTTCCRNMVGGEFRAGDFYFPGVSDTVVPPLGGVMDGYYRDRLSQHIRLHRQSSGTITGQFQCTIPQANGPQAEMFINIGECIIISAYIHSCACIQSQPPVDVLVTITPSGDNTLGDGYSLMCSTRISTGLTGQPTITWLDSMDNEIISTNGILTFNPLMASDAGMYTCRATLDTRVETAEVMVTVQSECLVTAFFMIYLNL